MTHVIHRQLLAKLPCAVGGHGPYVIDKNGKQYLDASGGAAVSTLGHNHPVVLDAIKSQLDKLAYAHSAFFTTDILEELADTLSASAPDNLNQVYFVSGGSEAMESALKLARQYFLEIGESQRKYFITRRQSYHGNTLGALGVSGNAQRRQTYEPIIRSATQIAPCYAYRDQGLDETEIAYGLRVANELETAIHKLGAEQVIAFIAEPVVGATAGAVPAVPEYFKRIREICDEFGVLLILDEVMCGMGRTGKLHASEFEGISGDLVTIAKGLAGGYQPIGAMLVDDRIYSSVRSGSGFFQHGHTYTGHAAACAAALAVQTVISEQNLLARIRELGEELMSALKQRFADNTHVGDIRGRGLLIGLELVADRESKKPFDPALHIHDQLKKHAMRLGLMCYPMAGTIDGHLGHHVLLAPPYVIESSHIDEMVTKLGRALDATTKQISHHNQLSG